MLFQKTFQFYGRGPVVVLSRTGNDPDRYCSDLRVGVDVNRRLSNDASHRCSRPSPHQKNGGCETRNRENPDASMSRSIATGAARWCTIWSTIRHRLANTQSCDSHVVQSNVPPHFSVPYVKYRIKERKRNISQSTSRGEIV